MQFELDEEEQKAIKEFNEDLLEILKKTFLPEINPDAPIMQMVDMWAAINFKEPDMNKIDMEINARQIMIEYLIQRFSILEGKILSESIKLNSLIPNKDKISYQNLTELSARNSIIFHIDIHLNELKLLAGIKKETVAETKERLRRDSNK